MGTLVETGSRLALVTAPAAEPLSLAEVKDWLRLSGSDEDDVLTALIASARILVEDLQGRALVTQTHDLTLQGFGPGSFISLPKPPLQSVTSVSYMAPGGSSYSTLSTDVYAVNTSGGQFGSISLKSGQCWPDVETEHSAPVVIRFVAGYGDAASDVPETTRLALRQLVAGNYEHREPVVMGRIMAEVPNQVERLIDVGRVYYGGPWSV